MLEIEPVMFDHASPWHAGSTRPQDTSICTPQNQLTLNDTGKELTCGKAIERSYEAYRDHAHVAADERGEANKLFKATNRHLIETTLGIAESHRAVLLVAQSPLAEHLFREEYVRPRKKAEEVPAVGMIPGRAERNDHLAPGIENRSPLFKNLGWVSKMLKGIDAENQVC